MPWVMNMEVKNVTVEVVDNDRSSLSQRLVHSIEASEYFLFKGQRQSYSEAIYDVDRGKADIILVVPQDFGKNVSLGKNMPVLIAANAVNGTKGALGSAYMSQIVAMHVAPDVESVASKVSIQNLYNKRQNYKLYMIPALLAIVLMLMCGFLPALNIVGEKEAGTMEQINVTPVNKWTFILAKMIPYWIIAMFIVTVCLLLAWGMYGVTCAGNLGLVYLLAILLALFFSSFGLIISNYSDTMQQAIFVMWFFVVCLLLLSGLFTPTRSMPEWAYATTYVNPMHYFIDGIRTVFIRGGDFASIAHQVGALLIVGLVMGTWAVVSYKKNH